MGIKILLSKIFKQNFFALADIQIFSFGNFQLDLIKNELGSFFVGRNKLSNLSPPVINIINTPFFTASKSSSHLFLLSTLLSYKWFTTNKPLLISINHSYIFSIIPSDIFRQFQSE